MRFEKKEIVLIIFLLVIIFLVNYSWVDKLIVRSLSNNDFVMIDEVIDGDTVKFNGTSVRLLGMNTPEKGELYYDEARIFLEEKVLNKTVRLEYGKDRKDKYGRTLAYLFLDGKNVNLEIVEEGFANYYFPAGKDIHYDEFVEAWEICLENEKNLCERSLNVCSECIELKEFVSQEVTFVNTCEVSCNFKDWTIKDEGRKTFVFPDIDLETEIKVTAEDFGETYVWTETGDTLFLRDDLGKLVLWNSY